MYTGDTALHVAAAAHHPGLTRELLLRGARVRARNRRGAEPLHYAADGNLDAGHRDSDDQGKTISTLVDAGADPDATDMSGVAPIHRAVRTRSIDGVRALIDNGANPFLPNKSGSTPLHLAVQSTGKSNAGSEAAKQAQAQIIALFLDQGARPSDRDAKGKTVAAAASSQWIRQLLDRY